MNFTVLDFVLLTMIWMEFCLFVWVRRLSRLSREIFVLLTMLSREIDRLDKELRMRTRSPQAPL